MTFGLNSTGFNAKALEDVKTEIEDSLKADIDPAINVSANSVLGQLIGVFSGAAAEIWEVLQAVYAARDPDQATGESLDALGTLTGSLRRAATPSTVTATVNLNNGTTLPIGSQAYVAGNTAAVFQTTEEVSNTSGIAANFSVAMESVDTGEVVANAGTLTEILTPVSGWNSITNAADATLGSDEETDAAYRLRRDQELRGLGAGSVSALRSDVLSVDSVEEVFVYENTSLVTDGDGLPGKSFEVVVLGGTAADVAAQIFETKPAGIETYGTTSEVVTDSQGFNHTIYFTRPTEKIILVEVFASVTEADYPVDGDDQIRTNILALADEELGIGDDIIVSRYYDPIFSVSGVDDVTTLKFYDNATLGSEVLSETAFTTVLKWSESGDWDLTAGAYALYTHSSGTGSLTQVSGDFASALSGNRWCKFTYTISNVTGSTPTGVITTGIGLETTDLDLSAGTHTVYVFTKASPGDFVITITSTSACSFRMDDVTLKMITQASGNYTVASRAIADLESTRIAVVTS